MTYEEVFASEKFKEFFTEELSQIDRHRDKILEQAHPGARLKSSAYVDLKKKGNLSVEYFTEEFHLIYRKMSQQSVSLREFIYSLVQRVTFRTVMWYDKEEKRIAETPPVEAKPKRKKRPQKEVI